MLALYLQIKNLFASEEGQDLIEYALIVALMIVLAIVGLQAMGTSIGALWTRISVWLNGVTGAPA